MFIVFLQLWIIYIWLCRGLCLNYKRAYVRISFSNECVYVYQAFRGPPPKRARRWTWWAWRKGAWHGQRGGLWLSRKTGLRQTQRQWQIVSFIQPHHHPSHHPHILLWVGFQWDIFCHFPPCSYLSTGWGGDWASARPYKYGYIYILFRGPPLAQGPCARAQAMIRVMRN